MDDYATRIENFLTANELYSGRYDRLWSELEAHRIDEREPGDGTRISPLRLRDIWTWLVRTEAAGNLKYWERH